MFPAVGAKYIRDDRSKVSDLHLIYCDLLSLKARDLFPGLLPYYGMDSGKRGLNGGTLMMHLGRMRAKNFTNERNAYVEAYGPSGQLLLGDQDVMNYYGYMYPDCIFEMPCIFHFRYDAGCEPGLVEGSSHTRMSTIHHYNRITKLLVKALFRQLETFFLSEHGIGMRFYQTENGMVKGEVVRHIDNTSQVQQDW